MSVIELTAKYRLTDDFLAAIVTLSGDLNVFDDDEVEDCLPFTITLLHEELNGQPAEYDYNDSFTVDLAMCAGESLTIIARHAGRIIGSLVNEVDTSEGSRVLLHPKGGFNVIVYQERCPDTREVPGRLEQEINAVLAKIQL
jgi:hypothetical protein